jgi:acetyltransferase-like isoleucine patch superfamily enzyme
MTSFQRTVPTSGRGAKLIASILADLLAMPLVLAYRIAAAVLKDRRDDVFQGYSQFLSLWPGYSGVFVRCSFYRRTLRRCAPDLYVGFGTLFVSPETMIGNHVYIGARCMIAHCEIADDVLIGSNVDIIAGPHTHGFARLDVPVRLQGGYHETVTIGRDVWIGNGATVLSDIGEQAVVAAGAVVVKPVPPRSIVGGNPALVLRERTQVSESPAPANGSPAT